MMGEEHRLTQGNAKYNPPDTAAAIGANVDTAAVQAEQDVSMLKKTTRNTMMAGDTVVPTPGPNVSR